MKNTLITSLFIMYTCIFAPRAGAQSFTFGAAGDFGNGNNFKATVNAVRNTNPAFMIGLGDLSYTSKEQEWCDVWKSAGYTNFVIVSGNHDTEASKGGDINKFAQFCPYTLPSPLTGTYAKQYYFDYPSGSPLARIILGIPGISGPAISDVNGDYKAGSPGYNFVSSAIDDARSKGIKWIVVGMHKNYISAMEKPNELGPDFINMLINKKVDLILQGHEHGYERTKQLKCAKINTFDNSCVVDSDNSMVKGVGSVIHILGTGGQGTRGLNTNDSEYGYFAATDVTTYGFGKFTVTPNQLTYQFIRSAGGTFTDTFAISDNGSIPAPTPSLTPIPPPSLKPSPTLSPSVSPPPITPSPSPCAAVPNTTGTVSLTVSVPVSGTYKIWTHMMSQGDASNSYYLRINGNCAVVVGDNNTMGTNAWSWIDYRDGNTGSKITVELSAGTHTFTLMNRENGTRVDSLLATLPTCTPQGDGNNCAVSIPTAPTTSTSLPTPTPSLSPPTSSVQPNTSTTNKKNVVADAFVSSSSKDKNYGKDENLKVDTSPHQISYLKFDLRDSAVPSRAILRLRVSNYSRQTLAVYTLANTWNESSVTYNNRPSRGRKRIRCSLNKDRARWTPYEWGERESRRLNLGADGALLLRQLRG